MSEELLEYVTEDDKKLPALTDNKPVGDGYYINHNHCNRSRSCGTCALVGMCQYCPINPLLSHKRYESTEEDSYTLDATSGNF